MQGAVADEQKFALAMQNARLFCDRAIELRRVLGSMRSSAQRVQTAQQEANASLCRERRIARTLPPPTGPRLTTRERAILELIAEGLDNEEIADRLNFGHGTIKLHVRGILAKFGTSNRTVAAVRAVRLGII